MSIESLFNSGFVTVTVTYHALGQTSPFVFYLRPMMNREARNYRQMFLGLTDEEQEARKAEFNARLLGELSVKEPEGLPNFEPGNDLRDAVFNYFNDDNLMRQKLAEDAINLWLTMTQPEEFFRFV